MKNFKKRVSIISVLVMFMVGVTLFFSPAFATVTIGGNDNPGTPTEDTNNDNPGTPTEDTNNSNPGDKSVSDGFVLRNPLKAKSLEALITDVIKILIQIGLSVAVLFIVYSGYLFVTAGGNSEKVSKAGTVFLWAVVGTAILLGALVIMQVVQNTINQVVA